MRRSIQRPRRPGLSGTDLTLLALLTAITLATLTTSTAAASPALLRASTDTYTNPAGQHETQVEPSTFSRGATEAAAFQQVDS